MYGFIVKEITEMKKQPKNYDSEKYDIKKAAESITNINVKIKSY